MVNIVEVESEGNSPGNFPDISLSVEKLARTFKMTGANIVNIIQFACLKTLANNDKLIRSEYISEGIKREYAIEGKTITISI